MIFLQYLLPVLFQSRNDILFSNAGMLKLSAPIRETLVVPDRGEAAIEAFGAAAFRDEVR